MKKFILAMVLCVASMGAFAQKTPHAVGLYLGGNIDLAYQYHFNNKNFVDATLGCFSYNGVAASATYNWNIQEWSDWTPNFGTWKLWGGVGAGLGAFHKAFILGPVGQLGFGFTLKAAPVTIGVNYRPMITFGFGGDKHFHANGFYNGGLSVVYRF
jgi:hypothetical protein